MNPTVSMWLNIALAVAGGILAYLAADTQQLTPIFGQAATLKIVSISGLAVGIVGAVNAALHGISTAVAGPVLKFFKKGA